MRNILLLISVIVLTAILLVVLLDRYFNPYDISRGPSPTDRFAQTLLVGPLTVGYPEYFGLAAGGSSLLPDWQVPPCDLGFDYCLFYVEVNNSERRGGGIRISKRTNLDSEELCLNTSPLGHEKYKVKRLHRAAYSTSLWTHEQDAATTSFASAGQEPVSVDRVYRIFTGGGCYELERRTLGASDQKVPTSVLNAVIESIVLTDTQEAVAFPH